MLLRKILNTSGACCATALLSAVISVQANATFVTIAGENFDITYDDQALGAFGAPRILGDTVVFTPGEFLLDSNQSFFVPTQGSVGTSTVSFVVNPKGDFDIASLGLTERGDYSVDNTAASFNRPPDFPGLGIPDPDPVETDFSVSTRLFVSSLTKPNDDFAFFEAGTEFSDAGPTNLALWQFSQSFNVSDFSTGFLLTVQNTLNIENVFAGSAFIQKKYVGIELSGTEVPVPASFILFGSALGLMVVARKSA